MTRAEASEVGEITNYNGIYNKEWAQGKMYWSARNDVGGFLDSNLDVKLYYYEGIYGSRWALEGTTATFFAPTPETEEKKKLPAGIEDYFGMGSWIRVSRHETYDDTLEEVTLELACSDTMFPTFAPTLSPTEHPT